jgi:hypothetical protein
MQYEIFTMPANLPLKLTNRPACAASVALVGLLVSMSSLATAQVYRCETAAGPVYQANACMQTGRAIDLRTHFPTADEAKLAQNISSREEVLVAQIEGEREKARREAATERERVKVEKDAQAARCEKYLADAKHSEEAAPAKRSHSDRIRANDKARALRSRHFSECFAR